MLKGAVVGSFGIVWKAAGGKLSHVQMIADAPATDAFFGTGLITAIAPLEIFFLSAFH